MGDHVVLNVDHLVTPQAIEKVHVEEGVVAVALGSSSNDAGREEGVVDEEEPLIQTVECRICQEEDHIKNLESPCACSGSLKYAHRACVQRWCNEKGDITCEICHESYKPGYTAPPRANPDETTIDISGGWTITGSALDLRDPRILAMAAAQRHFLEAEYDEYAATNASGAAFCRSAALILMALLLLRHALTINSDDGDDDASAYFSLFLLRAAGFLLPCYIMAWAISILQRRRQRQWWSAFGASGGMGVQVVASYHSDSNTNTCNEETESGSHHNDSHLRFSVSLSSSVVRTEAAALAASEVAFILQSSQARGLQFTIAPESPATPQQEPHQ